jgi:hypothetical protein
MAGTTTSKAKKKTPTSSAYIGTAISPSLVAAIETAPRGVIADIVGVAHKIAASKHFTGAQTNELTDMALSSAYVESGFKPKSPFHTDVNGPSGGLFQLHSLTVPSTSKATGGQLAEVPGATIVQQEKNALNPVTAARVAIGHIADTYASMGSMYSPGQIVAASQGPANPTEYAAIINGLIPGGINMSEADLKVKWPKDLSAGSLANAPLTATNQLTGGSTSASKTGTTNTADLGGLLAKVGGFILAVVLIGVGLVIMAKDTDSGKAIKHGAELAAA